MTTQQNYYHLHTPQQQAWLRGLLHYPANFTSPRVPHQIQWGGG